MMQESNKITFEEHIINISKQLNHKCSHKCINIFRDKNFTDYLKETCEMLGSTDIFILICKILDEAEELILIDHIWRLIDFYLISDEDKRIGHFILYIVFIMKN